MKRADNHNQSKFLRVVPNERRRLIRQWLGEEGSITVAAVQAAFGVSAMTARRDLSILEDEGRAQRTYGGAMLPARASHENSFAYRLEHDVERKRRIAAAAAPLLRRYGTVFVDCSTTAYYTISATVEAAARVTILTNSVPIMGLVASRELLKDEHRDVKLVGIGGTFRKLTRSFVGPDAVRTVNGYLADAVVLTAKAITAEGLLTDPDPLEAEVKRSMMRRAGTTILLARADTFVDSAVSVIAQLQAVDIAVVADAPARAAELFAVAGTQLIAA